MTTLAQAFKMVDAAKSAHDLFNGDKDKAQKVYRDLAKVLHPDHVPAAKLAQANAVFAKLSTLWTAYESGDADRPFASTTIATRKRAYVVGQLIAQGDIAGIYEAEYREDEETKSAALKVTRSPVNNDLVGNEANVLRHLAEKADPKGLPYLSKLLDSFRYRDATSGADRQVNVLTKLDADWYTLSQVKAAFPDGLDIRDALWMWKRLLIGIGHAHRAGVVHGAVTPDHVLINGPQHGLCIVDWCYASIEHTITATRSIDEGWDYEEYEAGIGYDPLKAIVPKWKSLYPGDVLGKKSVSAKTDVAMASKTILSLFNSETPVRFTRFAQACVKAPHEDAWELMNELTDLAEEHFPREFRPFAMPA